MKKIILIILISINCVFLHGQDFIVRDTFFNNYIVEDKFRWLENTNSPKTMEWVKQQNSLSDRILSRAINKTSSYRYIDKYSYVRYNSPHKVGNYYFSLMSYNDGVPALFFKTKLEGEFDFLVDPNKFSIKDKIVINDYFVSMDSKLLAYKYSVNGSDWNEVKVVTLANRKHTEDHLTGLKFSPIAWLGNGFFYTTYSQDSVFGQTNYQKIFYHNIGDKQSRDSLIFKSENNLSVDLDYTVTSDERYFVLEEYNKSKKTISYYYIDFKSDSPELKPLILDFRAIINVIDSPNGKLIGTTRKESNNSSIVEIEPGDTVKIKTIVKEKSDTLLLRVIPFTDRLVAVYQANQRPIIMVIDYNGRVLHGIKLPVASSAAGFSANISNDELYFNYTTYTVPPVGYKLNIKTFKKELIEKTEVNFDFNNIEYKEVEYLSKDGVRIPMILVYEKGIKLDGSNPTILNAYGGFGIVETPSFDAGIVYFIKQGGIYAFANIRGGGEKGYDWAKQGRGLNKQKSFDDFIAAAEFLIRYKYTRAEKLAATGASNGGLVVAAAAIQRPDLFKAVVPVVAPLDMIRFEKFTAGHWWVREYGTVTDSLGFNSLLSFSPYHNIKDDVNYPSMLIVTSENDDRVPPFHSYKFAAKLQNRDAQKNAILLKVRKNSGHNGSGTSLLRIQDKAEIYGYILNELMQK